MKASEIVAIKGVNDGLWVSISPTEEWQAITSELAARIDEKIAFFAGAKVTVDVGERPVPKYELSSLKALLERRGLTLAAVHSESETTLDSAQALDVRTHIQKRDYDVGMEDDIPIDPEEAGTVGVLIKRTLRSGRTVHSRGHVVVFGDVNPGAKIIAVGDVIVWGKLRGMVHAGAEGDTDAIVCALEMTPNQIRIAGFITTSPIDNRHNHRPEVACVRDNQIVVETWG